MAREDKKAQFANQKAQVETSGKGRSPWLIAVVVLVAAGAVAAWTLLPAGSTGQGQLVVKNGAVQIPASELAGGTAKFYTVKGSRGEINFFLVQSQDGVIRAAFDTCDVCYREKKGYRQEGDLMVCNNCNQSFPSNLINVAKGGCNPAPLERDLQGDQVVIQLAALEQGSWYFNGHSQ